MGFRIWPVRHWYWQPPIGRQPRLCSARNHVAVFRGLFTLVQFIFVVGVILCLVLLIGREVEERAVNGSPSTVDLYDTPEVCSISIPPNFNTSASDSLIETIPNMTMARSNENAIVAHCGFCGACSNPHDVKVYDETKNTLTDVGAKCGKLGLLWGRKTVRKCLQARTDLSDDCVECWVENVMCDFRVCVFTCLWQQLTTMADRSEGGELNPCTRCDEQRCGRRFVECAGANRRRVGIVSDIERDANSEVCNNTDPPEWWKDEELQSWWQEKYAVGANEAEPWDQHDDPQLRGSTP